MLIRTAGYPVWLERFRNFSRPLRSETTHRSVIIVNSGFHEIESRSFSYFGYKTGIKQVLQLAMRTRSRVIFLSTAPALRRHTCPNGLARGGLAETFKLNILAREACAEITPAVGEFQPVFLDVSSMRLASPFEGDGHHCVGDYIEPVPYKGRRKFGASCSWRLFLFLHLLATEMS